MTTRACNACSWQGVTNRTCGSIGPLCHACGETTEVVAATPTVDGLTSRWEHDGASRGAAYMEMRDLARRMEEALRAIMQHHRVNVATLKPTEVHSVAYAALHGEV